MKSLLRRMALVKSPGSLLPIVVIGMLLILHFPDVVTAQPTPALRPENVHIASPTASALGKIADVPISYHTGIPNVDIPIYTVQEGPLRFPINLSYHAAGLKVMEQASWVGAGWSLSSSGMITRIVRGNPDELSNSAAGAPTSYLSGKGYYSYLYQDLDTVNQPKQLDYFLFGNGSKDGEPDLFTFNFNGYTGKFYFRPDNSIVLAPQQDIRITPLFCGGSGPTSCATNEILYGWIATTPDGVKYYFGSTTANTTDVDALEYTLPYSYASGQSPIHAASSWFLYKIESPDNRFAINLNYVKEQYSFYMLSTFPVSSTGAISASNGVDLVKNFIYGVRLSSITTSTATVTFTPQSTARLDLCSNQGGLTDYDPTVPSDNINAKALASIQITNPTGTSLCQTFAFDYDYFYDNTHALLGYLATPASSYNLHSDKRRLKLKSVTEKTCDGSIAKPPYAFTYFDETSVPRTLSFAQDHWGFYNGVTGNTSMLPPLSKDNGVTFSTGADREAYWPAMRAGALQKIQYPTGGSTEFTFQAHENGYVRSWYTWEKGGQLVDLSAGFTGSDYTSQTVNPTLAAGKYFVEVSNTLGSCPNGSGALHLVSSAYSNTYSSNQLVDLPAGTYSIYVTFTSGCPSGNGAQGKLFIANSTLHQETPVIGGLRVASIKYSDGISSENDRVETYSYVTAAGQSSGVLFSRPNYISLSRNDRQAQSGIANGGADNVLTVAYASNGCISIGNPSPYLFYYSPASVHPMRTSQGNHIGYNEVKVTQSNGGYTIYKFSPDIDPGTELSIRIINAATCDPNAPNFPPAPVPFVFKRGELVNKSVYNAAAIKLQENIYNPEYSYDTVGVTGLIVRNYNGSYNVVTEYELKSGYKIKNTEESYTYDILTGQSPVYLKTDTYYGSRNHKFPTKIVVSDAPSNGKVLSEEHRTYTSDIVIPSCGGNYSSGDDNLMIDRLISVMATYQYQKSLCGTNTVCLFNAWKDYYIIPINEQRKNWVNNRVRSINAYKTCMKSTTTWNNASTDLKALIKMKHHNQAGQVIESSQWRDGKLLASSFLTYKDFEGDTISIFPGKLEVITAASPLLSSNFAPVSVSNSALTKDPKYLQEETYAHKNGNLVEATAKNGVTTSYLWDSATKLPIVKAVGVSYSTLSAAYAASGNNLSTLRAQTSLAKAQVTTYVYDPLIGVTSQTDPNSKTISYQYDGLGRLILVKDHDQNAVKNYQYHYKQ